MKQVFLNPIILAVDTKSDLEAYEISQEVSGYVGAIKLGLEYFNTYGPEGIRKIQEIGIPIFLDLKLHDIPMTVRKTIETLSDINPAIINVHAFGGQQMMKYALDGLGQKSRKISLVAVTVLTSLNEDDMAILGIDYPVKDLVQNLAKLTKDSGLAGVVCSAEEIALVRKICGKEFMIIVPGIRPEGSQKDDQKRVMTPKQAISLGADYLVIGRPITQSKDPLSKVKEILKSIQ
ncbi:MAG: orotidine-5'-phosphate decarboxylase [Pseudomonadota bacterium]|nr:orotidine-5'-phosphate decarboxylase [Pseudomonadota bacterium]MEC7734529.1 orotidine-5'-phosphate decarboxylase [Pseudomonadota bacterium]MEC9459432.1 orotidine-5'-phosphate decarboxylase [Pseudomonadota bacterium]MEC9481159.1 orotidine-5'-phosphate decarboxylase [Pseudomonadota bacterium]